MLLQSIKYVDKFIKFSTLIKLKRVSKNFNNLIKNNPKLFTNKDFGIEITYSFLNFLKNNPKYIKYIQKYYSYCSNLFIYKIILYQLNDLIYFKQLFKNIKKITINKSILNFNIPISFYLKVNNLKITNWNYREWEQDDLINEYKLYHKKINIKKLYLCINDLSLIKFFNGNELTIELYYDELYKLLPSKYILEKFNIKNHQLSNENNLEYWKYLNYWNGKSMNLILLISRPINENQINLNQLNIFMNLMEITVNFKVKNIAQDYCWNFNIN